MKGSTLRTLFINCLLASALLSLSACKPWQWFKDTFIGKKEEKEKAAEETPKSATVAVESGLTGEPLVTMEGKPVVTADSWNKFLETQMQSQPQLAQVLQNMPQLEFELFRQYLGPLVIELWAAHTGKDQTPEYKETYQEQIEQAKKEIQSRLAVQTIEKEIITDIESNIQADANLLRTFYDQVQAADTDEELEEENGATQELKNPQFIKEFGGVYADSITFTDKEQASEFLKKAQKQIADDDASFADIAAESGLEMKDLGLITQNTKEVDPLVKRNVLCLETSNVGEITTQKGETLVVHIRDTKNPVYKQYDEVSVNPNLAECIKGAYIRSAGSKALTKKLEAFEKEVALTKNFEYFQRKFQPKEQEGPQAAAE